jgi:hypothetical protein
MSSKIVWILIAAILAISAAMVAVAIFYEDGEDMIYGLLTVLFALVAVMLALVIIGRKTSARLAYDGLHVKGPMLNVAIPYGEIVSTELRDSISYGIRIGGYGGIDRLGGHFRNSEFGNYKLGVKRSVNKYIVIRRDNNKVIVFNLETAEETVSFYNELRRTAGK